MSAVKNILIVGGGTAGWLCAAFLAKQLGSKHSHGIQIRLVESPEIGIIGVGEGSFPSIRGTLAAIGIDEAQFVRECQATFKQGIRFDHWLHEPHHSKSQQDSARHYFHPFNQPSQRQGTPELLPYWLQGIAPKGMPFAQAVSMQKRIADAYRAPKRSSDGDFLGPMNYAYHFDAALFAKLLAKHAKNLGVQHLLGNVHRVELDREGAIDAVHTHEQGALKADLYIDCTGFRARLIGQALQSEFHSVSDTLFVDRALAIQVPYPHAQTPIASYTISTAQEAGWIWDIGLQDRRGVGYVYSSRHTDQACAERVLRDYLQDEAVEFKPRLLELQLGYRPRPWIKNCVAIGLSGGFLEPLEASGIGLVEAATYLLAYLFPFNGEFDLCAQHFNHHMSQRYERIVDFIKLHYCISQRRDHRFWIDNADIATIPSSLRDKLALWKHRPPHRLDFNSDLEMYPTSSWQYVLYGMHYPTQLHPSAIDANKLVLAEQEFAGIAAMSERAVADLPDHRQYIQFLCEKAEQVSIPKKTISYA
ncbi:tryptophan 7-halogenase [Undibacterium cyanobacteriorum]|uniref:Tryptophan 7-halogenase n=1 Tax=Undibacterium cyanobacteriorum TaxID=3073561 RepID=A0ABY9RJH0_9BURK|nr:tryptophan 7-halogenase [Undibacterium sp. 20NA77.5]WMW81347.1 tryptophan 7-halogenase [Undibacterium sp. 20NA77.5]